jgi:hypothetical protein
LRDLTHALLDWDAAQRLGVAAVHTHPLFSGIDVRYMHTSLLTYDDTH